MVVGYAITFALAIVLLIAYLVLVKQKEFWLTMLYVCVSIVNLGYLLLSIAKSLEFAIFANDLSYFGSVFLCMCMLLTIVELCGFKIKRWHVITGLSLALVMFSMVATSGFLPWYYKSLELDTSGGYSNLIKEYGVLHKVYMFYLIAYFLSMLVTIVYSAKKHKIGNPKFAGFIAGIVCSNIIVWAFEKFVHWQFEFLSVTYLISELLLLLLYWMIQDYIHKDDLKYHITTEKKTIVMVDSSSKADKLQALLACLPNDRTLTSKELEILGELIEGKSRREIAIANHISENTVKTHIAHIYEKFKVSSKEALFALIHKD